MPEKFGKVISVDFHIKDPKDPIYRETRDLLINWAENNFDIDSGSIEINVIKYMVDKNLKFYRYSQDEEYEDCKPCSSISIKFTGSPK